MSDNYSNPNPYQYGFDNNMDTKNERKAMAIVGLVLSIIAFIGICFCIGLPFGIAGLIICIIVLVKGKGGKGMAIAGTVLSGLSVLISSVTIAMFIPVYQDMSKFVTEMPEVIEDYQEDGSLPDYLEKYREQYPEYFEAFMEGMIEEYEKNPEAYQSEQE
jgi:hypothetical protein